MVYVFMAVVAIMMAASAALMVSRAAKSDSRMGRFYQKRSSMLTTVIVVCLFAIPVIVIVSERRWAAKERAWHAAVCQSRCGQQRLMACGYLQTGSGTLIEQPRYSLCATPDGGVEVKMTERKRVGQ